MSYYLRETLEKEVKLRAAVSGFHLPDLEGQAIPRRVFTSTYYDTKNFSLGSFGITLRLRVENNKRKWQLKLPSGSAGLELEIPGNPKILPPAFKDLLFALLRGEDPVPVAKLRTERRSFHLQQNGKTLAEIAQDSVALLDGRQIKRRISEIEIELINGNQKDLASVKHTLEKAGAFEGDPRPKLFQALDLVFPEFLPRVDPSASPIDHLKGILQRHVREILAHDPGTRFGKDSEELHQMRVATRRFRALLRSGQDFLALEWGKSLRTEAGWLGGILGTVRDFDVLLGDLFDEIPKLPLQDQKFFQRLMNLLATEQSIARATMLEALRSDRYRKLLNRLEQAAQFPETVATNVSLHEIAALQFKKLRNFIEKSNKNHSDDDLHRIRIRAKRARYAAELAECAVGKPATRFIRQIKRFQDLLGDHQDAVMTEHHLRRLLGSSHSVKAALAVGQIVERLRSRKSQVRKTFPKRWGKLKKCGKETWEGRPSGHFRNQTE